MPMSPSSLIRPIVAVCLSATALAQCATWWAPGAGIAGVYGGPVHCAVEWDPDGAGPLPPRLVVGGAFTRAGSALTANIAAFDPQTDTWSALGTGTDGVVRALAATPGGDLIVGGSFATAGGIAASNIARWNGAGWAAIGGGQLAEVVALAVLPGWR